MKIRKRKKQIDDYTKDKTICAHLFLRYELAMQLVKEKGITQAKAYKMAGMSQTSFYRVKRHLRDGGSKW